MLSYLGAGQTAVGQSTGVKMHERRITVAKPYFHTLAESEAQTESAVMPKAQASALLFFSMHLCEGVNANVVVRTGSRISRGWVESARPATSNIAFDLAWRLRHLHSAKLCMISATL